METRWTVETRPAGEAAKTVCPGEAMEATGAGAESGEPNEGIAPAVIRPVGVVRRARGIAAAARRDTTVIRVIRGKGVARRAGRLGRGWSRSAQYGRGRKWGDGTLWSRRGHRRDLRTDRYRPAQSHDKGEGGNRQNRFVHLDSLYDRSIDEAAERVGKAASSVSRWSCG